MGWSQVTCSIVLSNKTSGYYTGQVGSIVICDFFDKKIDSFDF
jgi:hypothetical protein